MVTKTLFYFYTLCKILHSVSGDLSKGSLTFVIDDTGSMLDEIAQVKEKTNQLFDAVLSSNASQVDDFILVTFNDPGTQVRTITKDRSEFKRALDSISVDGGGDCAEYAMTGIELALKKSKPNSFLYVYTDAAAKDFALFDRVKSLSLKKSTKVTFLLTGQCPDFNDGFVVFDKLAVATRGEVFHIDKHDIDKITDYIIESVKHVKTTLAQKFFTEGSGKTMQFNVDSKSWDVIISVSATNPNVRVTGPDGKPVGAEKDKSIATKNTRMEKLKVNPGPHTIFLDTNGPTSVVVTASTSVTFEHGFSTIQPVSLNETATKPMPGEKSYLAISLNNYEKDIKLQTVEIRDAEDNVINTYPLKLINDDTQFYVTKAFLPPSKTFKLAVMGFTKSGEKIVRLGSTTIERQDVKLDKKIDDEKPTATMIGEPKLIVDYNKPLTIKCQIHAYPKPEVIWQDSAGTAFPSTIVPVDLPYDYISIINFDKVNKSTTLTCKATNIKGVSEASVNIEPDIFLKVIEQPKDTTIRYGETFIFKIDIDASPPPKIVWFKKATKITSNDDYDLSPDNSSLTIKNINYHHGGEYTIEMSNGYFKENISFRVSIYAELPKIDESTTNLVYEQGSNVVIKCNVTHGFPKPKIVWSFKYDESSVYSDLAEKSDTLRLENVKKDSTGTYMCTAVNDIGKSTHEIDLLIEYPPLINGKDENIKTSKGKRVTLNCPSEGEPSPNIKWFKNNVAIRNSATHRISNKRLLFKVTFSDSVTYTCEATNHLGKAKKNFHININAAPSIINPLKDKTLRGVVGDLVLRIPCKAVGSPKPTITWMVDDNYLAVGTDFYDVEEDGTLLIKNLTKSSAKTYKCKAENSAGSNIEQFNVEIQQYPNPGKPTENILLEEGTSANIECDLPHTKKDVLHWYKDRKIIATNELQLKNVQIKDSGIYTCRVSSFLYSNSSHKMITVGLKPKFLNEEVTNIVFSEGSTTILGCGAISYPPPTVKWYHNGFEIDDTSMERYFKMTLSDIGNFTCKISNAFGEITRTFNINQPISQECILNIENDLNGRQPLILTNRNQWYLFKNTQDSIIIPKSRRVRLFCPGSYLTHKTSSFTEQVTATCIEKSKFKINSKIVNFKDLKCHKENKPLAKLNGPDCGLESENTELLTVGFNIRKEFLGVYDVCINKDKKVPIFANYKLYPSSANVVPKALIDTKFAESKHLPFQFDYMYKCSNQLRSFASLRTTTNDDICCYTKRQLVSPKDVLPGLPQLATYNYLNVVPHWSSCGTENWDEVELRVRQLVKSLNMTVEVWTGSSETIKATDATTIYLSDKHNEQPISPYIWKVLHSPENDEALAIIQINKPGLTLSNAPKYVPCKDICNEIEWMRNPNWYIISKGFIVCCRLEDFQTAFGYTELSITASNIFAENVIPESVLK